MLAVGGTLTAPGAQDVDLGIVPFGTNGSVRLVEVATLAGDSQQIIARNDKLYFALQNGTVAEFTKSGDGSLIPSPQPFLNVATERSGVFGNNPVGSANGLRGIAFHPDFDSNGKFYSMQCETRGANPTHTLNPAWSLGTGSNVDSVLTEWTFHPGTTQLISQREVYRVQYPAGHHIGQNIAFNPIAEPGDPDYGNLYIGFGDSGGQLPGSQDFSADNVITTVSQDGTTVLGKMIRINPLEQANQPFTIPTDNPFVGNDGQAPNGGNILDEVYALGFRNPQTMAFDPVSGMLLSGDVSHNNVEEINLIESGANYGWAEREGTYDFTTPYSSTTLAEVPLATRLTDPYTYPVAQFDHKNNLNGTAAIIAGAVYHGTLAPELDGLYLFGNLSTDQIFFAEADQLTNNEVPAMVFRQSLVDHSNNPISLGEIVGVGAGGRANMRFGQDSDGELYLFSKHNDTVYLFTSGEPIAPPSILGDLDLDGSLTTQDIDQFVAGWLSTFAFAGVHSWMNGDLNLDARVDLEDVYLMHTALADVGIEWAFGKSLQVPETTSQVLLAPLAMTFIAWSSYRSVTKVSSTC
ncbi:PQQ-dependent sugar dehydrogenase [Aeoliella mucimassa]|uniref:Quinoprotein glucose dehydrogenase B n=1 Tax=Aeoliella mucimassa TaxID=2527972 RepID=A0A518AQF5_9BACT|nr:PQQ-dependent sugar dehydrogenase [Aeoliella mucimassa]QDU56955.1 Quinoprotein glucose dehydrogenase B precursor [Aeoliella mucimassa]